MNLNQIYTLQSYLDEMVVKEKQAAKDYEINVTMIADDDNMIAILVDGNHSYEAAKRDGAEPTIKIVENNGEKTLERYTTAFGDLSNPINIVTGKSLW